MTVAVTVGVFVRVGVVVGVSVGGGAGIAGTLNGWAGCAVRAMPGEIMKSTKATPQMAKATVLSREKRFNPLSSFLCILFPPSGQVSSRF